MAYLWRGRKAHATGIRDLLKDQECVYWSAVWRPGFSADVEGNEGGARFIVWKNEQHVRASSGSWRVLP